MTRALLLAVLLALAPPLAAQDGPPLPGDEPPAGERPFLEEWAEDMMRGLVEEIEPEIERFMDEVGPELGALFAEMVPRLRELTERLGGLSNYEMPEVLPNGDIIIRRKPDAPPVTVDPDSNEPIEL